MTGEERRLLIREGIGFLGLVFGGGKRRKVNNILASLDDALTIYENLNAFDKRLSKAVVNGVGINLSAEETASLASMIARLKSLDQV